MDRPRLGFCPEIARIMGHYDLRRRITLCEKAPVTPEPSRSVPFLLRSFFIRSLALAVML